MTNFFVSKARRRAGRVVDLKVPTISLSGMIDKKIQPMGIHELFKLVSIYAPDRFTNQNSPHIAQKCKRDNQMAEIGLKRAKFMRKTAFLRVHV